MASRLTNKTVAHLRSLRATMSQKSSVPQAVSFVSQVLKRDNRVGTDGIGEDGVVGYLYHLAGRYPVAFCKLLSRIIEIEEVYPQRFSRTSDHLDADQPPIYTDRLSAV